MKTVKDFDEFLNENYNRFKSLNEAKRNTAVFDLAYKEAQRVFGKAVDTRPTEEDYVAAEEYVKKNHGDKWHVEAIGINKTKNKIYIEAFENFTRSKHASFEDRLNKEHIIDRPKGIKESKSDERVIAELDKYFNEDVDENFDIISYELGRMSQRAMQSGDGSTVPLGIGLAIIAGALAIPSATMALVYHWDNIKKWFNRKKVERMQKKLDSVMGVEDLDQILDVLEERYPETYKLITSNRIKDKIIKGLNQIKSQKNIEDDGSKNRPDILKNIDPKFMEELVRRLKTRSRQK